VTGVPVGAADTAVGDHGIDADRVHAPESLLAVARRRLGGRYPIDPFGGDPHLIDLLSAPVRGVVRVRVEHGERLPEVGGALLVANRGLGLLEPAALAVAVREVTGRRLRIIGAPDLPVLGPAVRKLGALGGRADDVAALLRAGHLAAAPLAPTWLRPGAGEPPRALLASILGFPVIPVAVLPGGPVGLPLRAWRVIVGEMVETETDAVPGDALVAAELAERVRDSVRWLVARA
jgi:1-acyl-sn-glycerol-3-phosphate acyltransferase